MAFTPKVPGSRGARRQRANKGHSGFLFATSSSSEEEARQHIQKVSLAICIPKLWPGSPICYLAVPPLFTPHPP